ncbi:hypothetical protein BaRGS_00029919 [Batillaria attramentaria]|uniref:C-type lectin domain-containing protein n=1 Tax=Batillaria attramentaria TaxID=370345 RepID=A0ABD0JUP8_9CAEN
MAKTSNLTCLLFNLILVSTPTEEHEVKETRSDDVSFSSLETLVQQQAALIQTLQTKLNAMETRLTVVEQDRPKPEGWTHFHNSCYGVGHEAVTWADAVEICRQFGAHLADVETSSENEFIKDLGRSRGFAGTWLGATDIMAEGRWVWTASGHVTEGHNGFSDWYPGQPGSHTGQRCMMAEKTYDYRWGDYECFHTRNFICEIRSG